MSLNIPITLRTIKGDKLTWEEADNNFVHLKTAANTVYTLADSTLTTINNPTTGLDKAHSRITTLSAVVTNPLTGLAKAHSNILVINGIINNATSGLPKAHARITVLENAVNNPISGLIEAHIKIGEVSTRLDEAMSGLTPSLNFVGAFATDPVQADLGTAWVQNAIYKNTVNNNFYILTGSPLSWAIYTESGTNYYIVIESSNGTAFKTGYGTHTTLKARLFKNGAEVTELSPASWFSWRRASIVPKPYPDDDATWNALYSTGYKQVDVPVDDFNSNATFFCDIIV